MISKITQSFTRGLDKTTHFSMKGVALAGSAIALQQLMFCASSAYEYITSGKNKMPEGLIETEIDPLTQHAIAGSAFAIASIALGRFAFLSKLQF